MLELFQLGTGGTYPLVTRALSSSIIRIEGKGILIDCGEATQLELQKTNVSAAGIDYILITHLHADHVSGLLGMFLAIKSAERTKPIVVVGPKFLKRYIESMFIVTSPFPFPLKIIELEKNSVGSFEDGNIIFRYTPAKHKIPCFAYSIELKRKNRFNIERVLADGIPNYSLLELFRAGKSFVYNGTFYNGSLYPEILREELLKGRKVGKGIGEYVDYNGKMIMKSEVDRDTWMSLRNNYVIEYNGHCLRRKELNISLINELSQGKSFYFSLVTEENKDSVGKGKFYNGQNYIEGPRRGLKVSYVTDTRPLQSLRDFVKDSDIAIIEGMYRGDEGDKEKALEKYHMTWDESVSLVKKNGVREMILTHYSPSLQIEKTDKDLLKSKFSRGVLGRDGLYRFLAYDSEENKEDESVKMKEVVKKKPNFRLDIVKKYLKQQGLQSAVLKIEEKSAFEFLVTLAGDVKQTCFVYKSLQSLPETYHFCTKVDDYYVIVT